MGIIFSEPLGRHDLLLELRRLHAWRSWEVVYTCLVVFDGIVLFKTSIGWLHQALRVNLTIQVFFSCLKLRSYLRYDLLLLVTALHHLMDTHPAIVHEFYRAGGVTMKS